MSSGVLSQEEIDALLRGADIPSEPTTLQDAAEPEADFSELEKDVIGEIANISMGTAATTLSTLLGKKVDITTPRVFVTTKAALQKDYPSPFVVVDVTYTAGLEGNNVLIIRESDVAIIVDLMMGGDGMSPPTELNEIHFSAISEAMNQMMGSASTSMATMLQKKIDISPPMLNTIDFANEKLPRPDMDPVIKVSFRMVIEGLVDSELMQIYPIPFAKQLVSGLMGDMSSTPASPPVQPQAPPPPPPPSTHSPAAPPPAAPPPQAAYPPPASHPPMEPPMAAAPPPGYGSPPPGYGSQPPGYPPPGYGYPPPGYYGAPPGAYPSQPPAAAYPPQAPPVPVQPVQFAPLQPQRSGKDTTNLGLIMDVPLQVTVELGKSRKTIRDILELGPGAVIELDKLAGEPVDILVNGKLIAKGEVVVIDENFGVRITDIVSPIERIGNLQ
ncbi:flagellar motor switch phosphatase FliY [Heliobacterium undosum]|uniref:Flagellar motor switch phosphatase FliY n=1 Tax=Heliomicrobium undosum TaxID=121734 RepID=A0A845L2Q8_9FIRM|nr:flagellar motor switch phosphatase FliY [Heliomicrobium undosum]